ncbi:hypothetical protein EW026_g2699 [Hermanssonia centrifuga]|uniref:Zn(2)-C6 fungal-type domain-containing protein n=1 Tax=Hermanssonia centrifuga TaxID=98765 RepID=A0A4V3XAX4_9APHY|nr:hypothetical protein EW026_g2699 [Hermanssonia centrifuga]
MYQDDAHQYNVPYFLQPPTGTPLYNPYAYGDQSSGVYEASRIDHSYRILLGSSSSSLDGALNETQLEETVYSSPHMQNVYNPYDYRGSSQSDMSDIETSAPTCHSYQPAAMDGCWQDRVDEPKAGFPEGSSHQELQRVPMLGDVDTHSYSSSQDEYGDAQSGVGYVSGQTVPVCLEEQDNHTDNGVVLPSDPYYRYPLSIPVENSAMVSPSDSYYEYVLNTPVDETTLVIHSAPLPYQISRCSTLADAMTPVTTQPPALPLPPPVISPASTRSPTPSMPERHERPARSPKTKKFIAKLRPLSPAPTPDPNSQSGNRRGRPRKCDQERDLKTQGSESEPPTPSTPVNYPYPDVSCAASHSSIVIGDETSDFEETRGQSIFKLDILGVPKEPKKKPIMACLFCRDRKISCGPPLPGQEDQRCKQCIRRNQQCEWPKESRRGQHKRTPRRLRVEALVDANPLPSNQLTEDLSAKPLSSSASTSTASAVPKPKPERRKYIPKPVKREEQQSVAERRAELRQQRRLVVQQRNLDSPSASPERMDEA